MFVSVDETKHSSLHWARDQAHLTKHLQDFSLLLCHIQYNIY